MQADFWIIKQRVTLGTLFWYDSLYGDLWMGKGRLCTGHTRWSERSRTTRYGGFWYVKQLKCRWLPGLSRTSGSSQISYKRQYVLLLSWQWWLLWWFCNHPCIVYWYQNILRSDFSENPGKSFYCFWIWWWTRKARFLSRKISKVLCVCELVDVILMLLVLLNHLLLSQNYLRYM